MSGPRRPGTLRGFLALSQPWLLRPRTIGGLLLLLGLTGVQVVFAVLFNGWTADLFDALERRDGGRLWREVGVFALLVLGIMLSNASQLVAKRALTLSWRRALTERLLQGWMAGGEIWRLAQTPGSPDNPDGRIAEDTRIAAENAIELASGLIYSIGLLATFTGILWSLSGVVTVLGVAVPGHMVLLAGVYAAGGAIAAFALGAPLARATEQRQAAEADMRFSLAQARENALGLSLAEGEALARATVVGLFGALARAWHRQTEWLRNLNMFQSAYITLAPVFPILVAAPRYLAAEISLGGLMQTGQGFQQVVAALSWPVDNAARLAEWRASAQRILELAEAVRAGDPAEGIVVSDDSPQGLSFERVVLREPDGRALTAPLSARIAPGARVAVTGEAQQGGVLLHAVAGLWPWGDGRIRRPPAARIGALPRAPWLPEGRLADLLAPPGGAPPEILVAALEAVWLGGLRDSLDERDEWDQRLDEQDRYRLAFARLLLRRPDIVLLEEPSSVVGAEETAALIGLLSSSLPDAIVMVADRAGIGCPQSLELRLPDGTAAQTRRRGGARGLIEWLRRGFPPRAR
ncbi:MAG: SbmA/BacA-like family transporter [Acetobacteraceae bacterium]|nr:SbmA/BacA-like family transporter [Acetobacteraceae bacterium]